MLLNSFAQACRLFLAQIWERQYQGLNFPSDSDQGFEQTCLHIGLGGHSSCQAAID